VGGRPGAAGRLGAGTTGRRWGGCAVRQDLRCRDVHRAWPLGWWCGLGLCCTGWAGLARYGLGLRGTGWNDPQATKKPTCRTARGLRTLLRTKRVRLAKYSGVAARIGHVTTLT